LNILIKKEEKWCTLSEMAGEYERNTYKN